MAVYFIKYICWEIVLFNYFRNVVSDTKMAVRGISVLLECHKYCYLGGYFPCY